MAKGMLREMKFKRKCKTKFDLRYLDTSSHGVIQHYKVLKKIGWALEISAASDAWTQYHWKQAMKMNGLNKELLMER